MTYYGTLVEIGLLDNKNTWEPTGQGYVRVPPDTTFVDTVNWLFDATGLPEGPVPGLYEIPQPREIVTSNVIEFNYIEDATSRIPGNYSGGSAEANFTIAAVDNVHTYLLQDSMIRSDMLGTTFGRVRRVSTRDEMTASVTTENFWGRFNTEGTLLPFQGTLLEALKYIADQVGVSASFKVTPNPYVTLPGGSGNIWDMLKQMLIAYDLEMVYRYPDIIVQKTGQLHSPLVYDSITRETETYGTASFVEINYYNNVYGSQVEVFPVPSTGEQILSVGANTTEIYEIEIDGWVKSVEQPECVEWVDNANYTDVGSVYSVVNTGDRLPVLPEEWLDNGGRVTVRVTDDPSVIEVTVKGANIQGMESFELAMSSGNYYNSLHIVGEGVTHDKKVITIPTGADSSDTSQTVGATIDNPYISSLSQALDAGNRVIRDYVAPKQTLQASTGALSPVHAFGMFPSSVVSYGNVNYRIETAHYTQNDVTLNGSMFVTVDDHDAKNAGLSVDDASQKFSGQSVYQVSTEPLQEDS